jgi:hypothetical protein
MKASSDRQSVLMASYKRQLEPGAAAGTAAANDRPPYSGLTAAPQSNRTGAKENSKKPDPTPENSPTSGKAPSRHATWLRQIKICLPLLEIERREFIGRHFERLADVVVMPYWDPRTKEEKYLRDEFDDRPVGDPLELSLAQLARMPSLIRKIVLYNTCSYPPFFPLRDELEPGRLVFLANAARKLGLGKLLSEDELEELFRRHEG